MVTADTITDEQIRELRRIVVNDRTVSSRMTDEICNLCALALDEGRLPFRIIREARARCAEIWNARHATEPTKPAPTKTEQSKENTP